MELLTKIIDVSEFRSSHSKNTNLKIFSTPTCNICTTFGKACAPYVHCKPSCAHGSTYLTIHCMQLLTMPQKGKRKGKGFLLNVAGLILE